MNPTSYFNKSENKDEQKQNWNNRKVKIKKCIAATPVMAKKSTEKTEFLSLFLNEIFKAKLWRESALNMLWTVEE